MSIPPPSASARHARDGLAERRRVTAVLGPTNTGKTHLAIERMMGHETGMIGLPLRLLAREVYDRVARAKGARHVALITGEEKILPRDARYFVCTVEAMPLDRPVEFLAVDEIQLAADRERGHTFTDRLLRARGLSETMMLGSETARGLIQKLLPETHFIVRPRFSELTWTGSKKLTRLPRRSAVVAFSADRVYAIAEMIRRQRGGAAVVMGALSPRTRNAQVALYQSGDVDFLVATDAIGMGLNMDVDHVAFASTQKFDGYQHRSLHAAELAQIAGRAGRHMNDGTFGVTGDATPLDEEAVSRIESHRFEPLRLLQWRNPHLEFSSLAALMQSLERPPERAGLTRAPVADDLEALTRMARNPDVLASARTSPAIERLWEVAQLPDFRKTLASEHADLLTRLYLFLMEPTRGGPAHIPDDWLARQIDRLDRIDGEIDTLAARIAHIRTWTYVANRPDWLRDPSHWQERARKIEDKLSDALHERLTQRFVDRRTSVLMKRLRQNEDLMAAVNGDGEVLVEGEYVGRLQGFVFVPDPRADGEQGRVLRAAADQALAGEIAARAQRLAAAPDADISLSDHGRIVWTGHPVADLKPGAEPLNPHAGLIAGEELNGAAREAVQARLDGWLSMHVASTLAPLVALRDAADIDGLARGIAFRLIENLGSMKREWVAEDVRTLDQAARGQLRKHGVRFGAHSIFMPALLKPAPARLLMMLWALARKDVEEPFAGLPQPPAPGLTSVPADPSAPQGFYEALGFRLCGTRAVRLDMLERIADLIRPVIAARTYNGGFVVTPDMMSLVGCSGEEFASLLQGLGYRSQRETIVPRPADASKQEAGAVETTAATMPSTSAEAALAEIVDAIAAPVVGEMPEAVPEPQTDTEAAAPAVAVPGETGAAAAAVELEIWRPARRKQEGRPARRRPPNKAKAETGEKPAETRGERHRKPKRKSDERGERPAKSTRPDSGYREPRKPRDREPDPDSPFAALAVLKERVGGN
ncbi:MAG: helicase-related protein [Parvibaculum sp.]|uniref:helicase-related protein n=1 Tax=Parvibaculum sp. TaxID=2024848 RepID=UPI0032ECCEC0